MFKIICILMAFGLSKKINNSLLFLLRLNQINNQSEYKVLI